MHGSPNTVRALGIAIFAMTYVLIALQRVSWLHLTRPTASLLGAVLMVMTGVVPLGDAYAAIDMNVIVFLLGLMLLVGYLEIGGFFEWTAHHLVVRSRTPARLLLATVLGAGVLSALFVNDTVCLVVTPVLLAALVPLGVRPLPYLLALAMGANVGSVLTMTGNPQNMLIGIWSGMTFGAFVLHMLPVALGGIAITYGYLRWAFRAELRGELPRRAIPDPPALDRPLVLRTLVCFGGALAAWLAGASLPLVAIAAGSAMILLAWRDPRPAIERVEWSLILFFASLFIVMHGLERTGAVLWLDRHAVQLIQGGSRVAGIAVASAAMTALSNLVSNVPAVLLWRTTVPALPDPTLMWRVLAMSSTLAGNLVLIGSMANLIVAERAETRGVHLGFGEYARIGIPVTLLTLAWGIVSLAVTG